MALQAILFDLDDTLITDTRDTLAALAAACATVEPDAVRSRELAEAVRAAANELWAEPRYGGDLGHALGVSGAEALFSDFTTDHVSVRDRFAASNAAYRREVWERAFAAADVDTLNASFREQRGRCMTVYPEVVDALKELESRYRLGVVTNGPADLQRLKLAATGLDQFFSAVVISGELGVGKPEPDGFYAVLKELDVPVDAALMVGDSLPRDVQGARNAGVSVALIDRHERAFEPAPAGIEPDRSITDLHALL